MDTIINNINTISTFLSKRDIHSLTKGQLSTLYGIQQADLIVLAGNCIPYASQVAANAYLNGIAKEFIIAGGDGHTTQSLRNSINEKYPNFDTNGRPEADILTDLFNLELGIKPNTIYTDNQSTNCGENAKFALEVAKANKLQPKYVLLMQDPTMQLRINASFLKEWANEDVTFINYAPFIPLVKEENQKIVYVDSNIWGLWDIEHFVSLILGEIPRLTDDANGYGPNGQGFITHVDIPTEVKQAYEALLVTYAHLLRK